VSLLKSYQNQSLYCNLIYLLLDMMIMSHNSHWKRCINIAFGLILKMKIFCLLSSLGQLVPSICWFNSILVQNQLKQYLLMFHKLKRLMHATDRTHHHHTVQQYHKMIVLHRLHMLYICYSHRMHHCRIPRQDMLNHHFSKLTLYSYK